MTADSPTVLHAGYHPQPGGGFRDLVTRVGGRAERTGPAANPIALIDSAACARRADAQLSVPVASLTAFGDGATTGSDYLRAATGVPRCLWALRSLAVEHDAAVLHVNSFRAGVVCAPLATLTDLSFVVHVHHLAGPTRHPWLREYVYGVADRIVHVSEHTRAVLGDDDRHCLVRSPIDVSALRSREGDPGALRSAFDIGDGPVVAMVGRLSENKGQRKFVRAAAQIHEVVPETTFLIVGSGDDEYRADLEATVEDHGIEDRVVFTGFWENIVDVYELATVVAVPSRDENLPKVIQEALAFECPVVASDAGGIPELVEHEATGLLVPESDDGRRLGEAIVRLLDQPKLAAELGRRGADRVKSSFDLPVVLDEQESLYRSLEAN